MLAAHLVDTQLGRVDVGPNLTIAEAQFLGRKQHIRGQGGRGVLLQRPAEVSDVLEFVEEPLVDLGQTVDAVHTVAQLQRLGKHKQTLVRGIVQEVVDLLLICQVCVLRLESSQFVVDRPNGLLYGLLEGACNRHDLTNTLHSGADAGVHTGELAQIPTGNLHHAVIETGLEARACDLCDLILDLRQRDAQSQLCSNERQRIAGGLGSKSRRTRKTSIDLDDAVFLRLGVQRILNVALTHHPKVTNGLDGCVAQHVVLTVTQRLRGCNDDGVTSVDTERVEVLHVAHSDAVVIGITHHLILYLLPALHGPLNQHLGR
eukprot:comp24311_c0_seq1/m.45726 comp24311_c0_seq1/g.45726  ORF comp24311_c0_seq1/g.45726 comp24311_c0_seq1/m.45726 type:complete len:317 (+) comp24311_c0_seq1:2722-3672(+)